MDISISCHSCGLPIPVDSSYSDGIDRGYCHACLVRLKALRDSRIKVLEPGKCSVFKCNGKSYFLIIKRLDLLGLSLEIPIQFCALHHYQIINKGKESIETTTTGLEFERLVDYEEI